MSEEKAPVVLGLDMGGTHTDAVLLLNGQISQQEARKRVATEEDGPYHGLEVDDIPLLPAPDDMAGEEPAL